MNTDISLGSITFDETGRIVLAVQRKQRWFSQNKTEYAFYTGIGGNLEKGETTEHCLLREALEETSTKVTLLKPITSILFINKTKQNKIINRLSSTPPLAIHEMRFDNPEPNRTQVCLVPIYLCRCSGKELQASGDVPAVMTLSIEQIQKFRKGVSIRHLQELQTFISFNKVKNVSTDLILLPFAEPRLIIECEEFAIVIQKNC